MTDATTRTTATPSAEPFGDGWSAPLRTVVITGSTRQGRFAPVAAEWFLQLVSGRADLTVDPIDLAEHPLPVHLATTYEEEAAAQLAALTPRLAAADAFVVITPEYNHSFPAPLKALIDLHFTEWRGKPVGFVSYGGLGGGLRAVEQLRLVFAELHAVTVRDSVSFHRTVENFGPDGALLAPTIPEGAAKGMLDQLVWWGRTLRAGRATTPYAV